MRKLKYLKLYKLHIHTHYTPSSFPTFSLEVSNA